MSRIGKHNSNTFYIFEIEQQDLMICCELLKINCNTPSSNDQSFISVQYEEPFSEIENKKWEEVGYKFDTFAHVYNLIPSSFVSIL